MFRRGFIRWCASASSSASSQSLAEAAEATEGSHRRGVRDVITDINMEDLKPAPSIDVRYLSTVVDVEPPPEDVFVIDVRSLDEAQSWGMIPTSKLLPAHELLLGLQTTNEEFKEAYGFERPREDQEIIFYCQNGPRAQMAAEIAQFLGFKKVRYYNNGYQEWTRQFFTVIRRWDVLDKEMPFRELREDLFDEALQLERNVAPDLNGIVAHEMDPVIEWSADKETLPIPEERIAALEASIEADKQARLEAEQTKQLPDGVDDKKGGKRVPSEHAHKLIEEIKKKE